MRAIERRRPTPTVLLGWSAVAVAVAAVGLALITPAPRAWAQPAEPETLADHIANTVDDAIAGRDPDTAMSLYLEQDHEAGTFRRNPDSWVSAAVDSAACASPSNSRGDNKRAGTLVTPRHAILAEHYRLFAGDTIVFVADDDTVHERTIVAAVGHPDFAFTFPDLRVVALDRDLPSAIAPCKVVSPELGELLADDFPVPALGLNQLEEGLINRLNGLVSTLATYSAPLDDARLAYYKPIVGGDSGNPSFLTIGGELVLVTVWSHGGTGAGTNIAHQIDALNQMIATADAEAGAVTGYTLEFPDLSAWGGQAPPNPAGHSGDVDCDGRLTLRDVQMVAGFVAGLVSSASACSSGPSNAIYEPAADVDRSGSITGADVTATLACLVAGTPCGALPEQ